MLMKHLDSLGIKLKYFKKKNLFIPINNDLKNSIEISNSLKNEIKIKTVLCKRQGIKYIDFKPNYCLRVWDQKIPKQKNLGTITLLCRTGIFSSQKILIFQIHKKFRNFSLCSQDKAGKVQDKNSTG